MFLLRNFFILAGFCGILGIFVGSSPCFITNCPPGGKRSSITAVISPENNKYPIKNHCIQCGPEGLGICLGPHLCCGPAIGCFIKTKETSVCSWNSWNSSSMCKTRFSQKFPNKCGDRQNKGICVAENLCCTADSCKIDNGCQKAEKNGEIQFRSMRMSDGNAESADGVDNYERDSFKLTDD